LEATGGHIRVGWAYLDCGNFLPIHALLVIPCGSLQSVGIDGTSKKLEMSILRKASLKADGHWVLGKLALGKGVGSFSKHVSRCLSTHLAYSAQPPMKTAAGCRQHRASPQITLITLPFLDQHSKYMWGQIPFKS
jgi:hypothetical protein